MRFLLGLCLGALLMVAVVEVTGVDAKTILNDAKRVIDPGGDTVELTAEVARPTDDDLPQPVAIEPALPDTIEPALSNAIEPALPLDTDHALPATEPPTALAQTPQPDEILSLPGEDPSPPADPADAESNHELWVPFYSQASAQGFADHLAATLQAAFAVRKRAAGEYIVVYTGEDTERWGELQTLLVQIIGPRQRS